MFKITDKKDGKKNFPFILRTELNTAESVTKIKKGKMIGTNWLARLNCSIFSKKPGASKVTIVPLKK